MSGKVSVLITFELAPEYVNQIWAVDPSIEVLYEPDLVGTPRFACDHLGPIRRTPEQEARWRSLLARSEVLFGLDPSHHDDLLELTPRLRWIQSTSAGVGQRARSLGLTEADVVLTTASGIHATALSEFCLMSMLMFVKDAFRMVRHQGRRHWQRHAGTELRDKTVAIIGLGSIGREVARAGRCLGMRAIGTKRTTNGVTPDALGVEALYAWTDLRPMLAEADFVIVSCPHTPQTEGLVGSAELAAMKQGAVLINIARGAIVDEPALIRALRAGHLGGAALDVTEHEPLPATSPLWEMPNVLICPHSGSNVDSENRELTLLFCDNLRRYLAGQPLRNVLDPVLLY
jgi:phosphoglycerate dehydrogenase-like enzyme